jgi:hypothetical protein
MAQLFGKNYKRHDLEKLVGDMHQIAGIKAYELSEGMERGARVYEINNGAGLIIPVLADRGMGIGGLSFNGISLAFETSAGAANPGYGSPHGKDWLKVFPGGFLTTCGLTQVGSPCIDIDGEECGQHGRISMLPAGNVAAEVEWENEQHLRLRVTGSVRECSFFGHNLTLKRSITAYLGSPAFVIHDTIENHGPAKAPFMFLQHFNLGFPLISPQTRLHADLLRTTPRDADAKQGVNAFTKFQGPTAKYREQVFYHDCKSDKFGFVTVMLQNHSINGKQGLSVQWKYKKSEFPYLVQWKMMGEGAYVCGIEPSNCYVGGRAEERQAGRLQFLAPGEKQEKTIEVSISEE